MILDINQSVIDLAKQRGRVWEGMELCSDPNYCLLAIALREATGEDWIVTHFFAVNRQQGVAIDLPSAAKDLVKAFDHDEQIQPTMVILPEPYKYASDIDIDAELQLQLASV